MQYNPEDSIKIAIADMGVGMFVTAIEQNKRVNLANAGRVSTQQGIEKLKASGVKFVWVDQKLSSSACVFKPVAAESEELSPVEEQTKVPRAFRTREAQHKRAKKLIAEAKGLAQKLLNQTFEGKVIEVNEIESPMI